MYCEKFKSSTKSPPMRKPFRQNDIQWKANDRKQETEKVFTRLVLFYIDRVKTDPTSKITCTHIPTHTQRTHIQKQSQNERNARKSLFWLNNKVRENISFVLNDGFCTFPTFYPKKVNFRWTENEWKGFRLEMWS